MMLLEWLVLAPLLHVIQREGYLIRAQIRSFQLRLDSKVERRAGSRKAIVVATRLRGSSCIMII